MPEAYAVAEAKSRFSELLNRAAYGKQRFLIRRRGKPFGAIVSAEDLETLESRPTKPGGALATLGLMADVDDWEEIMDEVVESRQGRFDERQVDLD